MSVTRPEVLATVKKPIICHICNFQPEYGGTFLDSLLFLNRYCKKNLHVAIFCIFPEHAHKRRWLNRLDEEEIPYGFVPTRRNIALHIRHLVGNYDPLVFHTHFFLYDLSVVLMKLFFYRSSKIVWHYHNPVESTIKQRIKDAFKIKLSFNYLGDRCIAVGDGVYKSIRDAGLCSEKAVLIHNGINTGRFVQDGKAKVSFRHTLGISQERIVFVLLGWDPVRKGVDIFVRAAEEMCRTSKANCTFLVIGRAEARAFVSQLICKSDGHQGDIRVIEPVENFSLFLKSVDVLVSASRSEGLPYAVLEAMAAGKLILSSDIHSVRVTYGKSEGVWLFPTEDWKALSWMMKNAASLSVTERKNLGQVNSQYVQENHSLETWAQRVGQVYRELLNNSASTAHRNPDTDDLKLTSEGPGAPGVLT